MQYWFEYRFPLNLLLDLGNFCIVILITYFFLQKYKVPFTLKIILLLSCTTPFLFNGLIIDWYMFPDQTKYLSYASNCRDLSCDTRRPTFLATGIIYGFSPILSLEGLKSIAFANRLFLILLILFLYLKKVDNLFLIILIFLPGIILYSSVSLRDTLVIIFSILSFYYFLEKKYPAFLISTIILFFLKFQTAIYIFALSIIYYIFFNIKNKNFLKFITLLLLTYLVIYFAPTIIDVLNNKRAGFFAEEFGDVSHFEYLNAKQFIFSSLKSFVLFLVSPLFAISKYHMLVVLIDTLILYAFSIIIFIKNINKNFNKSIFWIISLIGLFALHGLMVFNDGTIHRYKIIITIPILFSYIYSLRKND